MMLPYVSLEQIFPGSGIITEGAEEGPEVQMGSNVTEYFSSVVFCLFA